MAKAWYSTGDRYGTHTHTVECVVGMWNVERWQSVGTIDTTDTNQ